MENGNTSWCQSVTAVVIRDNRVLLARHTYGAGKGLLIIPGGYINVGETPQEAVKRECLEETGVTIDVGDLIGIRFNRRDWYVAFLGKYVSGEPCSDHDENNEVLWLDVDAALSRDDVPDLTKKLIESALRVNQGLKYTDYQSRENHGDYSLYLK
ncbi:MAG: NUDIX domain-containing protein [Clostridium sp.]|nr:NUDIX domain-containing protein [Clostridium sp.]